MAKIQLSWYLQVDFTYGPITIKFRAIQLSLHPNHYLLKFMIRLPAFQLSLYLNFTYNCTIIRSGSHRMKLICGSLGSLEVIHGPFTYKTLSLTKQYYCSRYCSFVIFLDLNILASSPGYGDKTRGQMVFIVVSGFTSLFEL